MKSFESNKITNDVAKSIYGGREVISTDDNDNGVCISDKVIIRNNGSWKIKMKTC